MSIETIVKAYDVRGRVPEEWSRADARALGAAFGDTVGAEAAVIGHDMRESGPALARAFAEGLAARGVDVTWIGLCSTDGLYHASGTLGMPGAMFTASHNPAVYNGIKMCRAGARPISGETGLAEIRDRAIEYLASGIPTSDRTGEVTERDMLGAYADFLLALAAPGARPLKVVVDAGNGMAGLTVPAVFADPRAAAVEIVPLYFELDGSFPNHEANPLDPKNLVDLQRAVPEAGADLGLAFDGDADRCFVVDEHGQAVTPSAITALVGMREAARELAAGRPPTVIHNLITSRAVPELLTAAGATTVRTRVGHSFIKATMAERNAVFGGEHSAHYYFRDFFFADSGMLAALHLLAALGETDATMSDLAMMYEPYFASGEINSRVDDADAALARLGAWADREFPGWARDDLDGVTFSHWEAAPRWWANVRLSNTEPLLRLNVEAQDEDVMEQIRDRALALIRGETE